MEGVTVPPFYRSDAIHPHHQASFRVFDPLDFLAEVSAHIPDAHEKTTIFYGWYSHRTRGYRKQHGFLGDARVTKAAPAVLGDGHEIMTAQQNLWVNSGSGNLPSV